MQINRDLYRNKLVHAIGNILSESHGLTHKSFDGCESEKNTLLPGAKWMHRRGKVFFYFLFVLPASMPQAAKMSSPRERRMVQIIPRELR